jgi:hypothetical protein
MIGTTGLERPVGTEAFYARRNTSQKLGSDAAHAHNTLSPHGATQLISSLTLRGPLAGRQGAASNR